MNDNHLNSDLSIAPKYNQFLLDQNCYDRLSRQDCFIAKLSGRCNSAQAKQYCKQTCNHCGNIM